jgi:hypothetical protein
MLSHKTPPSFKISFNYTIFNRYLHKKPRCFLALPKPLLGRILLRKILIASVHFGCLLALPKPLLGHILLRKILIASVHFGCLLALPKPLRNHILLRKILIASLTYLRVMDLLGIMQ